MKALLIALTMIPSLALAHVEVGTYNGKTATGQPCSMTAGETYFETGVPHPLNERIRITVGNETFVVAHPPSVNEAQTSVTFNHDAFQGILPTNTGARALIVEMVHETGFEGPRSYTLIDHKWRNNVKTAIRCLDLKLQN